MKSPLSETLFTARFTREQPGRLLGDRAYDSDPLDRELAEEGVELIAPHRSNRSKVRTQDGRACGATGGGGRSSA
jgi:hypothetical protein